MQKANALDGAHPVYEKGTVGPAIPAKAGTPLQFPQQPKKSVALTKREDFVTNRVPAQDNNLALTPQ